jgi:hypothetical protein
MDPKELDFIPKLWNPEHLGTVEALFQIKLYNNIKYIFCTCLSTEPPEIDLCGAHPSWCLHLRCRVPLCKMKKKWMVCVLCLNLEGTNKRMYSPQQTLSHNRYHVANVAVVINSAVTSKIPSPTASPVVISMSNSQVLKLKPVIHKYINFFKALQKEEAMKYVVNTQYCIQGNISSTVSPVDARLHTLIGAVTLSQSKNENKQFAKLLELIDRNNKTNTKRIQKERDFYR